MFRESPAVMASKWQSREMVWAAGFAARAPTSPHPTHVTWDPAAPEAEPLWLSWEWPLGGRVSLAPSR